jgi:hypothetical protein
MDHVSRTIVPAFYRYLQAQDQNAQIELGKEFISSLEGLVVLLERAEHEIVDAGGATGEGEVRALKQGLGLWVEGGDLGMTDVMVGPCSSSALLRGMTRGLLMHVSPHKGCIGQIMS